MLFTIDNDIWSEKDGLIHNESLFLKREEFNQKNPDIIAKNKEMLEQGSYIIGVYDEFFIPKKEYTRSGILIMVM